MPTNEVPHAHETHHPFKVIGYYLEALPKSASFLPMQTAVRCDVTSEQAEIERLKKERDQAIEWMGPTDAHLLPESEYPELYAHLKEKENAPTPDQWIRFDEQRPPCADVKVWAYTVGHGPRASIWGDSFIVDFSHFKPQVEVIKTYKSTDGTIRINCSAARIVTHWMPYHEPSPPSADELRKWKETPNGN